MIVIGIIFYFVGDALKNILINREHAILLNIQEAESRAEEAKAELLIAQEKLKQAKQKAFVIHKNG